MNDVCHGVEVIYSPYFFIGVPGAPREIIVGKNIYNFIFCQIVSYFQLLIFEVGCLDLVYCRFGKLMGFDFHFIFDFNFCSCIFTFIIHSYTIVRWLDSYLCWILSSRLIWKRVVSLYKKDTFIDILQNQIFIHFTEIFSTRYFFNYKNKVQSMNNQSTFITLHSKYIQSVNHIKGSFIFKKMSKHKPCC